jgi:IS30 family transposase
MKYMRYKHFNKTERLELSILLKKDYSLRDIGRALSRNPSSVSREIKRNSVNGEYDPHKADHKAYVKRKYSKYQGMKVRENSEIERYIEEKIKLDWSPEAIAGRLPIDSEGRLSIHHTGIYKYLYSPYGQHLCKYLQYKRYRKRKRKERKSAKEIIKNRIFIDQRPEIINQRVRCGDFELDTLGTPKTSKETLVGVVDRKSLYFLGKKIPYLKQAMIAAKRLLKPYQIFSLTMDNGPENASYQILGIPTFFCHPYSAWEKPLIENTFKRLRRYIPKKSCLTNYSDEQISVIIDRMNNIPRKCLGWKTPKEVFFQNQTIELPIFNLKCCTSG